MRLSSAPPHGRILGVFAKVPVAGQAKTRLAETTSAEWAQRVAQAFLEDSLDRFGRIQAQRVVVYTPASATEYFAGLAKPQFDLIPQRDGDLGERLHHFFSEAREAGYSRIIAVGTDSPTLPIGHVEQAFAHLDHTDVVIGPAFDGGYYLIGSGAKPLNLFHEIPWSTPRVLDATVQRLQTASVPFTLLPPWYDVDTIDDWTMLRGHVRAMRQAGLDPGVPRVERLILEQTY